MEVGEIRHAESMLFSESSGEAGIKKNGKATRYMSKNHHDNHHCHPTLIQMKFQWDCDMGRY